MADILLDTNFILTCIKQKIDFLQELIGNKLILPKQVIKELKKISEDKNKKSEERELAKTSLAFLEKFKDRFKEIELEKRFVDRGLELLAEKGNKEGRETIIATLDKELRRKLKGKVKFLIIVKRKKLEIIN
ncbi:MAG: PIN domain-containing protein [Candidatus Pacearchaeota archaeon]